MSARTLLQGQKASHGRSTLLSADDPVEEGNSSGMWSAGSRSPSPPAPPGDVRSTILDVCSLAPARQRPPSPPPTINRIDDLQRYSPPPPPQQSPYSSPNASPLQTRHRKSLSTGYVEMPRPPIYQAKRRNNSFNPSRSAGFQLVPSHRHIATLFGQN